MSQVRHLEVVGGGEEGGSCEADARLDVELRLQLGVGHGPLVRLAQLAADGQDLGHPHQLQLRHADGHHLKSRFPAEGLC